MAQLFSSSQVKLTREELCERTNCKTKYKLESLLGNKIYLGTIVSVSLGNNHDSVTWEQVCQSHLRTIVPVSLASNCGRLTWKQS